MQGWSQSDDLWGEVLLCQAGRGRPTQQRLTGPLHLTRLTQQPGGEEEYFRLSEPWDLPRKLQLLGCALCSIIHRVLQGRKQVS
ncbi:hypothetical protein E2C01_014185 [Portunus trituberculatus]|uniref:Uncharacterized protein n=1 Tax=Portunus trituberculatus TaxID=210409 RepID=A0A5B7DJG1_PORTR|nr:hypothetical protein [Portunus trituberculatus]